MRSATREALATSTTALTAEGDRVDLATAEDLFAAGRIIGDSAALRAALSDRTSGAESKRAVIDRVFGGRLSKPAIAVFSSIASGRWSSQNDLLAAVEELGIRAAATSAPKGSSIEAELFSFGRAVASDAQLELALGSKLGRPEAKVALVAQLLDGKASEATVAIVRQLVRQPRGRSVRAALRQAASVVADQGGYGIATVTTATELSAETRERLAEELSVQYGTKFRLNLVLDPTILGGMRVQVGDDVIDGSISRRIDDVRLRLAG